MSDDLKPILYGRTTQVKLADGNTYIMREPSIDSLESADFDISQGTDLKTVKKISLILLKEDNPSLDDKKLGRLITLSMIVEDSDFMNAIKYVLGQIDEKKSL